MISYKRFLFITLLLCGTIGSYAQSSAQPDYTYDYTITKEATSSKGLVVSAHPLASNAGLEMLKKGGNAVDAAIATQLALAVVYPGAGNLGGGGFMVLNIDGKKTAIDFRETAPSRSTADMYVDKTTGKANTHLSQEGPLSCGIPGTVAGLFAAMKYAKLPFRTLIEPAITLAEQGFILSESEAASLDSAKAAFERNNTTRPAFVKAHGWWAAGDTLIQPDLAQTLKRIRDNGKDGFYKGETARLIATEMQRSGGIISAKDLARYKVIERKPQQFGYRGYQVVTMPLPGSGGILLEQMLKMLEQKPLSQYGFCNTKTAQLITEVERRAYADRSEYLGDPDYYKVPVKKLVSPQYLLQRMADYDSTHAGSSDRTKPGNLKESNETTHLSIIDKDGNCASVTTTLNGWYGSKCVVAGAGFLLNDEMDDFSAQPGVPNQFGAIGGDANAIAPGKRMLSSMSPTIVFKNSKPFMIVGSPGGTTIITSVLQSIIDVIDFGMSAPATVNGPKFHHQWLPDEIYVEKNFPDDVRHQLRQMGYKVTERGPWSRTELIKLQYGNTYEAAADGRGGMDDVAAW